MLWTLQKFFLIQLQKPLNWVELLNKIIYFFLLNYWVEFLIENIKKKILLNTSTRTNKLSWIVKYKNCNQMGDQCMNDCLVIDIKSDVAYNIYNEINMQLFQNMKTSKKKL